jgi:GNAT superfamily N-acetyltransferase
MLVRITITGDLPRLVRVFGQELFFAERLDLQHQGRGILFAGWLGEVPTGVVYLRLEAADEREIRERLPGVALLQHLEVRADRRNQGVGTALIAAVEDWLRAREHSRVALGVRLDNPGATRLYARLGYVEWPHPAIETMREEYLPSGERRQVPELCRIFVKELDAGSPGRTRGPDAPR